MVCVIVIVMVHAYLWSSNINDTISILIFCLKMSLKKTYGENLLLDPSRMKRSASRLGGRLCWRRHLYDVSISQLHQYNIYRT